MSEQTEIGRVAPRAVPVQPAEWVTELTARAAAHGNRTRPAHAWFAHE
jgi:hypothetical protein